VTWQGYTFAAKLPTAGDTNFSPKALVAAPLLKRTPSSTFVMPTQLGVKPSTHSRTLNARRAELPTLAKATAAGLTLEQYKDRENSFLAHASKTKKPKTVAGYKLNLQQFTESLDSKIHYMDEVGKAQLHAFRDFLAGKSYEARTQHNRMMTVLSLLKANRVKTDFSLGKDLPEFEEEPAVPYEPAELPQSLRNLYKRFGGAMEPYCQCRRRPLLGAAFILQGAGCYLAFGLRRDGLDEREKEIVSRKSKRPRTGPGPFPSCRLALNLGGTECRERILILAVLGCNTGKTVPNSKL
jgi:hypothetical protein